MLLTSGVTLAVALAGCNGAINSDERSTTTGDGATTTTKKTTTETREKTETIRTVGQAETQYRLGTAHVHAGWKFAVVNFELTRQFQVNDESYEMPDGKTLGIATIHVENQPSEKRGWSGVPLAVIFDGNIYEKQRGFNHPTFSDYVVMDELKGIGTARQYAPSAYPVEPGETVTTWELFVLPEDVTRDEISVGFGSSSDDEMTYPVRWILN